MFEELLEDTCCTAGGSDSAGGKVESADIRIGGVVARTVRKVQLCARSDSCAVEEDASAECFNEVPAIAILRRGFDPPVEVPECIVDVGFKKYAILHNVGVLENTLMLIATCEYLDVLPKQVLRYVVNYQIMCYTTIYAPGCSQWQKAVCMSL